MLTALTCDICGSFRLPSPPPLLLLPWLALHPATPHLANVVILAVVGPGGRSLMAGEVVDRWDDDEEDHLVRDSSLVDKPVRLLN